VSLYERDGQLYAYSQLGGWLGTVTPQGVFGRDETPQGTFRDLVSLDAYRNSQTTYDMQVEGQRILADEGGIYQLDFDAKQLRQLTDDPARVMKVTFPSNEHPEATLWTRHEQTLRRYALQPLTEDQTLPSTDSEILKATHSSPLSHVDLTPTGEWSLDWLPSSDVVTLSVASVDDKTAVLVANDQTLEFEYRVANADGEILDSGRRPDLVNVVPGTSYEFYLLPPVLVGGVSVVTSVFAPEAVHEIGTSMWLILLTHALLGGIGAMLLSRGRVAPLRQQVVWLVLGLLFGVSS